MLGMGNMRQWLMNISLVGGWFPAAAFAVVAVLSVTLLVSAAVSKRDGRILATVLPIGVAAVEQVPLQVGDSDPPEVAIESGRVRARVEPLGERLRGQRRGGGQEGTQEDKAVRRDHGRLGDRRRRSRGR